MGSSSRLLKYSLATAVFMVLVIITAVLLLNWEAVERRFFSAPTEYLIEETREVSPADSAMVPGVNPRAFLNDASFFDIDPNADTGILVTYGKTADIVLSSVEKDLRIHIVDILGRSISGEEWSVTVNEKEYRDTDMDGLIYIQSLGAGEVSVFLHPRAGYRTPNEATSITVKQRIEYVAMNELDLRILSESQIDPSVDDVSAKMAEGDSDGSERTEILGSWTGAKLGIDVSKWNKEIDWHRVKDAGVEFAIIRLGYRGWTSGSLVEDPYYRANIEGAIEAGIPVGVYFFTQAVSVLEAVEEASMVIALVEEYDLAYPIFIDSEGTGTGGRGRADNLETGLRTEITRAFMETIRSAGYNAGVYAARNWLYNQLDTERLSDFIVWLAEYREIPLYTGYYQIWQYSSKGRIDGIEGNVDLNLSYLD